MNNRECLEKIPNIKYLDNDTFFLLAGPCAVESEYIVMTVAEKICKIAEKYQIPFVFKSSYMKANRSRLDSFTGIGTEEALEILMKVKHEFGVPIVTDIHSAAQAAQAASVADILQIPAFLCRQTDLLIAAAQTGKVVNIKKGQFLSAEGMGNSMNKVLDAGGSAVMLTERGTTFGYQDLIVDYRGIPIMREFGVPVIMDVTHSLQQPNQSCGVSGGLPHMIETIARAAIATGADGLFIETHPDPKSALCDGENMLHLDKLEDLISKMSRLKECINTL